MSNTNSNTVPDNLKKLEELYDKNQAPWKVWK